MRGMRKLSDVVKNPRMVPLVVRLDRNTYDRLQAFAIKNGVSMAAAVRGALTIALDAEGRGK